MPGLYKTGSKRKRPTLNSSQLNSTSPWHSTPIDESVRGGPTAPTPDPIQVEEDLDESLILSPAKRINLGGRQPSQALMDLVPIQAENEEEDDAEGSDAELFVATGGNNALGAADEALDKSLHRSVRFGPVVINPPSGHTFFTSILHKCGFILSQPKNHLRVDVLVFRRNMEEWLKENNDENSRIENETSKFLTAVNKFFVDKANLRHSCTTTLNDTEVMQPSLLHCLLGIAFLQPHVLKVILPILAEASFSNMQDELDTVATLMNQLKWLPILVDGKNLAINLMDILDNAATEAQKHMIHYLPEIFLPEFHPDLIPKLLGIFNLGSHVNVVMLDCFASLEIPEADCIRIRRDVVDQMAGAPLKDLPAYISFLFRIGSVSHLEEGITEMREKVEIKAPESDKNNVAYQIEILERIRFCVAVNEAISKIWIAKIKDDIGCGIDLKSLDLIMLLVFAESSEKPAIATLKLLFQSKGMVCEIFDKLMNHSKQMLTELFSPLSKFLDSILRMRDFKGHDAAIDITCRTFITLGPIQAQHLTSNLVGVIINGHPNCRDVALKIFTQIAKTEPKKLLYFYHCLMGALAYVIKFPPRQMQALMNVLAILANVPENRNGEKNTFTLEFMILLRKQISHTNLQTRCFGVLGTLAAVREIASHSSVDEAKINELLDLAWSSTERDEEACSIFFDELFACVRMLPKEVCIKYRDMLKAKFETAWTIEDERDDPTSILSKKGHTGLNLTPLFDANKEMDKGLVIIVLEPKVLEMSPLVVPSHLKVMVELEKFVEDGVVDGVDAVLGCPILFPKLSDYYEQDNLDDCNFNQRQQLGKYLALTTNYFRECISAFGDTDNPELRLKVWLRFMDIITLQKLWVKHLASFPDLPLAYGAEKTMSNTTSGPRFSGAAQAGPSKSKPKPKPAQKKGKKKKRKPKKKKRNAEDEEDEDAEEEEEEENQDDEEEVAQKIVFVDLEEVIQPKALIPYLRRLEPQVLNFLKYPLKLSNEKIDFTGLMKNISKATQSSSAMGAVERFNAETLSFLLVEMKQQAADKKRKFDILSIEDLLLYLCSHVDVITSHDKNDPEQQPQIDSCLRLLISAMTLYFTALKNLEDGNRKKSMTQASILTLASRYKSDSQELEEDEIQTQKGILENASKYILGISRSIDFSDSLTAFEHVKLLKVIHDIISDKDDFKLAIDETVRIYLKRSWKISAAVIDFFLKTWLDTTPLLMKTVQDLITDLIPPQPIPPPDQDKKGKLAKKDQIPNCNKYKSCSKGNFHTWYAALISSLAQHVHKLGRRRGDFDDSYMFWKDTIDLFKTLVLLSQQVQKPAILGPLLKYSRVYLEAFISGGVCLLPQLWEKDPNDGSVFIKTLQASTRRIQMICEHSKVIKDNTVMRYVPTIKKVLETLVFRVRDALTDYGAASAFWMGSLKHRDLDGKEITSQPFKPVVEVQFSDSEEESTSRTSSRANRSDGLNDDDEDLPNESHEDEETVGDTGDCDSDASEY